MILHVCQWDSIEEIKAMVKRVVTEIFAPAVQSQMPFA